MSFEFTDVLRCFQMMIIQTAWSGWRAGLRRLTRDQHEKGQVRSGRTKTAWLSEAMGFCLSSIWMYLELPSSPWAALLSAWSLLLSVSSFELDSPSFLHLFILFMGFSRKECWSGSPFSSPVDQVLSELSPWPAHLGWPYMAWLIVPLS